MDPDPPTLFFSISFFFRFPLVFLRVFLSFSKEVRCSAKRKALVFLGGGVSLALKQRLEGQGLTDSSDVEFLNHRRQKLKAKRFTLRVGAQKGGSDKVFEECPAILNQSILQRRIGQGGGKLRGGENIPYNPSQKTVLDTPPTYDTFPPPLCSRPVILPRGSGQRETNPTF